jgi:phosphoglycolate phosphatase
MLEGHLHHLTLMPGADHLVALADGWPQAVVSNKEGGLLRREVAHLGWNARFRAVVGAGDATADKPDPAPIWHALRTIGVKSGPEVWYVGDTGSDMQAARAAGCTAVLLGDAGHDGGVAALELRGTAPHLQCADASALAALLRKYAAL